VSVYKNLFTKSDTAVAPTSAPRHFPVQGYVRNVGHFPRFDGLATAQTVRPFPLRMRTEIVVRHPEPVLHRPVRADGEGALAVRPVHAGDGPPAALHPVALPVLLVLLLVLDVDVLAVGADRRALPLLLLLDLLPLGPRLAVGARRRLGLSVRRRLPRLETRRLLVLGLQGVAEFDVEDRVLLLGGFNRLVAFALEVYGHFASDAELGGFFLVFRFVRFRRLHFGRLEFQIFFVLARDQIGRSQVEQVGFGASQIRSLLEVVRIVARVEKVRVCVADGAEEEGVVLAGRGRHGGRRQRPQLLLHRQFFCRLRMQTLKTVLDVSVLVKPEQGHRIRHQHHVQLALVRLLLRHLQVHLVVGYLQDILRYGFDIVQQLFQIAAVAESTPTGSTVERVVVSLDDQIRRCLVHSRYFFGFRHQDHVLVETGRISTHDFFAGVELFVAAFADLNRREEVLRGRRRQRAGFSIRRVALIGFDYVVAVPLVVGYRGSVGGLVGVLGAVLFRHHRQMVELGVEVLHVGFLHVLQVLRRLHFFGAFGAGTATFLRL
jgi:hypothetical protein